MTVKGYYPSMSLGFEILLAAVNMVAGTGFTIVSLMLIIMKATVLGGTLIWLGIGGIPAAIIVIAAGGFAMLGSCGESPTTLKTAFALSIIALLACGGMAAWSFSAGKDLPATLRQRWYTLDNDGKRIIENIYTCCGYADKSEGTDDCKPEQPCQEPLEADISGKLKLFTIFAGICAAIQTAAMLCGFCVQGKMRDQQEHSRRKYKIDLVEEAKGGYNKGPPKTSKAKAEMAAMSSKKSKSSKNTKKKMFMRRVSGIISNFFSTGNNSTAARILVGEVGELKDGEMKEVPLEHPNGTSFKILLSRIENNYYATSHLCPHYKARLVTGVLTKEGRVTCPWHAACYNVKTGDIEEAPSLQALKSYPIEVTEDGKLYAIVDEAALVEQSRPTCDVSKIKCDPGNDQVYVVLGGGAAGAVAAESMRQSGFSGKIVVVSAEPYLPIDRIKLSKILNPNADTLALYKAEYLQEIGIEYRLNLMAVSVEKTTSTVNLSDGSTIKYDKLLIATGGEPRRLPIDGVDCKNVFVIRSIEHCLKLNDYLNSLERKAKVVVIGASFIGMEAAAMLVKTSESVTIVGPESVPMERALGPEVGGIFQRLHEKNGVQFHLGSGIEQIYNADSIATGVELEDGTIIDQIDIIVMGVGVAPNTSFLDNVIPLEKDGSIIVDTSMRVIGEDNIYAAGDIAKFPHNGNNIRIEHWDVAQQQGRIAGHNMASDTKRVYDSIPFFFTMQYGKSLRYAGSTHTRYDKVHLMGDDSAFAAYYVDVMGKVLAVATLGKDPLAVHCSELMRLKKMPSWDDISIKGINPLDITL